MNRSSPGLGGCKGMGVGGGGAVFLAEEELPYHALILSGGRQ